MGDKKSIKAREKVSVGGNRRERGSGEELTQGKKGALSYFNYVKEKAIEKKLVSKLKFKSKERQKHAGQCTWSEMQRVKHLVRKTV